MVTYRAASLMTIAGILAAATAAAQQPPQSAPAVERSTLQNVHATGKVMTAGTATGDDGKKHFMVAVRLDTPLADGVTEVAATVTRNEPSEEVRTGLAIHSGRAKVVDSVDVTCPVVNVMKVRNVTNAFGEDCTFNSYSGPLS